MRIISNNSSISLFQKSFSPRRCHRRRRWVEGGQRWRLPPLPTLMWVQEEGADGGTGPRAIIGAAINRRTSHKSRLLGARTSHQSRGAAPMISIANADVSARGRSRWWDRAPCRYSRGDHRISQRENEMEIHVITFFNTFMVEKWSLTLGFIKTKEGYISCMQFSAATAHGSKDSFSYQFSSINLTKCTYHWF